VRWRLDGDDARELDALAVAERECCSFLSWTVRRDGTDSVLTVTSDPRSPDDVAAVAALFAAA
jgi:hypothetical protein